MTPLPKHRKNVFRTFIAIALLLLIAGGGLTLACLGSDTSNTDPLRIHLPADTSTSAARDTLLANNLVPNRTLFSLMASLLHLDNWQPGSYIVQPNTPLYRLIKRITRGQQDPIRLTIGKFRLPQDLNSYLNKKLMHNNFSIPLDSFHLILPDTYEVYWTITPAQFMQRMQKEYNAFWSPKDPKDLKDPKTPPHPKNLIILASIVEEETNNNTEKPLIASVYLNRLHRGMPLQADPTVKYAVGDFSLRRILHKHLATDSPFNTYLHTGLPPAPICLPSKTTINAVINAPQTPYLYFCASPDMDGTHRFAASLDEHLRNAAAFHRALNTRGIH